VGGEGGGVERGGIVVVVTLVGGGVGSYIVYRLAFVLSSARVWKMLASNGMYVMLIVSIMFL
jgi:hypothetical protein